MATLNIGHDIYDELLIMIKVTEKWDNFVLALYDVVRLVNSCHNMAHNNVECSTQAYNCTCAKSV